MTGAGAVVLVSWAAAAEGSWAAAAALACAGADPDRAGLLVELASGRRPRPALVASVAARRLEERLVAHLPEAGVAARGHICQLALPADQEGLERVPAALALARETVAVVHVHPALLRAALASRLAPTAVLLRADLDRDRSLVGLAVRELMADGLRVAVLKRQLSWVPSRRALFGVLPPAASDGLPAGLVERCLARGGEPELPARRYEVPAEIAA